MRTRRAPRVAAPVPACGPWLPPRSRVEVEASPDSVYVKVRVLVGGVPIETIVHVVHGFTPVVWLRLVGLAWEEHRGAELQARAEARESASYDDPSKRVEILRREPGR